MNNAAAMFSVLLLNYVTYEIKYEDDDQVDTGSGCRGDESSPAFYDVCVCSREYTCDYDPVDDDPNNGYQHQRHLGRAKVTCGIGWRICTRI